MHGVGRVKHLTESIIFLFPLKSAENDMFSDDFSENKVN